MIVFAANGMIHNTEAGGVRYTANGMIFSQYKLYERIEVTSEIVDTQIGVTSEVADTQIDATSEIRDTQVGIESTIDTQVEVTSRVIPPEELPT